MDGRRDGRHVLFNALLGVEAWFSTRPLSAALISLNPRVVDLRIVGRMTATDAPVNASCWWKRVPVSIASSRIDGVRRIFLSFPTETTISLTRSALSVNARFPETTSVVIWSIWASTPRLFIRRLMSRRLFASSLLSRPGSAKPAGESLVIRFTAVRH